LLVPPPPRSLPTHSRLRRRSGPTLKSNRLSAQQAGPERALMRRRRRRSRYFAQLKTPQTKLLQHAVWAGLNDSLVSRRSTQALSSDGSSSTLRASVLLVSECRATLLLCRSPSLLGRSPLIVGPSWHLGRIGAPRSSLTGARRAERRIRRAEAGPRYCQRV